MRQRKTPSLHIRFDGFQTLDTLERWANRKGEKLVPWARQALIYQAQWENQQEIMQRTAHFSVLEALSLMREFATPEACHRAINYAQNYLDGVKSDVAKDFE